MIQTVTEHAGLKENLSGFWVEKVNVDLYGFKYHIHHQGLSDFSDSITESKSNLCDRFRRLCEGRAKSIQKWSREGGFRP